MQPPPQPQHQPPQQAAPTTQPTSANPNSPTTLITAMYEGMVRPMMQEYQERMEVTSSTASRNLFGSDLDDRGPQSRRGFASWTPGSQMALLQASVRYPPNSKDKDGKNITGQLRTTPVPRMQEFLDCRTVQASAEAIKTSVRNESRVRLTAAESTWNCWIKGMFVNDEGRLKGYTTAFNHCTAETSLVLEDDDITETLSAQLSAEQGQGLSQAQTTKQSLPHWNVPVNIGELLEALTHKAETTKYMTCDEYQTSPIYDFWDSQVQFVNDHRVLLGQLQFRQPSMCTDFLDQAQLTEDMFYRNCSELSVHGHPDTTILEDFNKGWRASLRRRTITRSERQDYVNKLYEKRMGKKREVPSKSQGGGGNNKKPRSEQKNKTPTGQAVTNPKHNSELGAKFLQNYRPNSTKLKTNLPRFYKDGAPSQRCINFDIKGSCRSDCPRNHTPTSTADHTAIWEAIKGIVGE